MALMPVYHEPRRAGFCQLGNCLVWVPGALKKSNNTEFLRLLGQRMATKDKYPEL